MSTGSIACCCPHCNDLTCGALPDGVPRTAFGPRLHAALSVLTGAYRLSKRQVAQLCSDLLGLTISIGMIAKLERITADVLEQPVAELAERGEDGRGGQHRRDRLAGGRRKAWLWVVVTAVGIVFRIARSRAGAVARDLLGEEPEADRHQRPLPRLRVDRAQVETSLLGPHHPNAIAVGRRLAAPPATSPPPDPPRGRPPGPGSPAPASAAAAGSRGGSPACPPPR